MSKCVGIGTKECHQMASDGSEYCSGCHIKKLEQPLEQSANWSERHKLRNACDCETNSKCVKCCVTKELEVINRMLKK